MKGWKFHKEMKCVKCGSMAINEHLHGRTQGVLSDHCDVCYWREMYNDMAKQIEYVKKILEW